MGEGRVWWVLDVGIEDAHVEIANRLRNYTYAASSIDQLEAASFSWLLCVCVCVCMCDAFSSLTPLLAYYEMDDNDDKCMSSSR